MEKKNINQVYVGIFLTISFIALLFLIFNLGGGNSIFSSKYTLYGKFNQVKGLHAGSEISLSGLRIGSVKKIFVKDAHKKDLWIEMLIDKTSQNFIRKDSTASIKTQGVLGDKYIEISIGSEKEPLLENDSDIETLEPEDFISKSGGLVEEIKKYFNKGGNIEQLVKNLNLFVQNLNLLLADVRTKKNSFAHELFYGQSGEKIKGSLDSLSHILKKIDEGEGSLGALINDPTVYEDIKALFGGAKRSSILKYFMKSYIDSGQEPTTENPPLEKNKK